MEHTAQADMATTTAVIPPPPRRRPGGYLAIDALRLITTLELLPLATWVVGSSLLRHLLPPRRGRGRPRVYADASILLIALIARTWELSYASVCLWLTHWTALAHACGLPPGRVIHPAHLSRRVRQLGAAPIWLVYLRLVARAIQTGLITGHDVILDGSVLPAWSATDPDAAWWGRASAGGTFGYKVHVLLDRRARLPILFALAPANRHEILFARPLLAVARFGLGLAIHVVRADGAYWGVGLVHWIVTVLHAHPVIPFNRRKQPRERVRHLAYWPLNYGARALIERFFAVAKRYYRLDLTQVRGGQAVTIRVCLTFCAVLLVGLAADQAGAPALRLSRTRVLAHFQPVDPVL